MQKLTLGSLFDGIGGFPLAAALSGITPVWAAEIDPACVAVTRRHFPDMLHFGDVSEIDGAKIPPVDIITFGSPCQDLSVAGKRAGLDGARSGLFTEAIRIIYEMREATHGVYPTFLVWENVPGAFSSRNGRDFQTVLGEIAKTDIPMPASGRWANAGVVRSGGICVAWRVLDAQYWGVPQRRKRIYLVGSFGDRSAEQILFKPDRVRRYLAPREAAGEGAAADPAGSACVSRTVFDARGNGDGRTAPTVTGNHNGRVSDYTAVCVFDKAQITSPQNRTRIALSDKSCAVTAQGDLVSVFKAGNVKTACTQTKTGDQYVVYSMDYATYNKGKNSKFSESISENGKAATQVAKGPGAVCYCMQGNAIDRAETAGCNGKGWKVEQSYTLNTIDRPAVVFKAGNGSKEGSVGFSSTVSPTLTSAGSGTNQAPSCGVQAGNRYVVRRLTPLECERLQGFPDEWTKLEVVEDMEDKDLELFQKALQADAEVKGKQYRPKGKDQMIRWYNKLGSDSQRYKQLGNSLAIPCALRVIGGIAEHIRKARHELKGEECT